MNPQEAFGEAFADVLTQMLGEDAPSRPATPEESQAFRRDLVATMVLEGQAPGLVCLAASEETAREAANRLLGFPAQGPRPEDLRDALAELLNVIAGGAKARLAGTPWHFKLRYPSTSAASADVDSSSSSSSFSSSSSSSLLSPTSFGDLLVWFTLNQPEGCPPP